jgi:Type ISP C-terminal specificity domain
VWHILKQAGHFREQSILPFLVFPFDVRYIYYVASHKWLNEARLELARIASDNEYLITVPEPRKASETWPVYGGGLINLHVHERGSVVFPRETRGNDLLTDRDANISEATWRVLRHHFGLNGERRGECAQALVGKLFRVAFAILHAPSYQAEHKSALSADWAHLPIPKDANLFDRIVAAGEKVARLLDANHDAREVIVAVLGADRARALGTLKRVDGEQVRPSDLKITVTYRGGGKGRWKQRPFMADELPALEFQDAWGERTGDLFLNDNAYFANVPELVWGYQLGGYPVLKKWLGYRQADRRDGKPLTDDERRWFRQTIQRVAALLALAPSLDALYQEAAVGAFTAEELGLGGGASVQDGVAHRGRRRGRVAVPTGTLA